MIHTVLKYKSEDGTEFPSLEQAEKHNFYLKVRGVLRYVGGPEYSCGYDGPMPYYEPDLRTLCAYKEEVRHLFLDVEPPEPKIIVRQTTMFLRKWPHWTAWVGLLLLGAVLGHFTAG